MLRAMPDLNDDLRPPEPVEPDLNECCGNGCTPCVFDTYAEEKRRWQEAVTAWDARHAETPRADGAAAAGAAIHPHSS